MRRVERKTKRNFSRILSYAFLVAFYTLPFVFVNLAVRAQSDHLHGARPEARMCANRTADAIPGLPFPSGREVVDFSGRGQGPTRVVLTRRTADSSAFAAVGGHAGIGALPGGHGLVTATHLAGSRKSAIESCLAPRAPPLS